MKTAKHTLLKRTLALTAGVALAVSLQVVNTSAVAAEFTAVPGLVAKHTSSSVGCELLLAPGSNGLAHIQVPQVEDVSRINVEGGEIINFDAVDQVLTVAVERQTFIRVTVN